MRERERDNGEICVMERDKGGGGGTGGGRRYASAIYYHHKRSGHASGGAATSEEGGVTAQRTEENDGNDTSAVRIQGSDGRDGAVGEGNVSGRRARKCGVCGSGSHFTHQCKDRYGPVCRSCGTLRTRVQLINTSREQRTLFGSFAEECIV